MRDLTHPRWMWLKGILLLLIGLAAGAMLWLEMPTFKTAMLLALCLWAFCRAYYFAFYVIGHYVDPSFKFSGLIDFLRHVLNRAKK